MKKRCFNVASHFFMMAVLLIGMMMIVPGNAQAATQQVKFIDSYSNKATTDQMINGMVNWYRINLPENWKYTDKDVTIKVSNESVAYLEYEKSEPNGFYLCANYDVPYNTYKPVTVTATKTDAAGNKKVATLNVHRYAVSCVPEKKTVYAGTTFKLPYKTITDGKSGVKAQFASINESVASISQTGMVTAKKAGKTELIVWNEGGRASLELTVRSLPAMSKAAASLNIGASTKLTLKNLPKGTAVTWKSSNTKIATVTNGTVKAKAPGKATITAVYKLEGKARQTSCVVTVNKPKLSQEKVTMSLRTSMTLKVTGATQSVKWESSNKKVATVNNGKVTAVGLGSCKIFATVNGVKLTVTVQVRSNEKNWKVVTRPGAYENADDDYFISKVRRNANGSITVEGYFVNTHKYNITSFDYMYLAVRDSNDNLIGDYKMPKFGFRANSYSVNKLTVTIPANRVRKDYDFVKNSCTFDYDYVFNYRW